MRAGAPTLSVSVSAWPSQANSMDLRMERSGAETTAGSGAASAVAMALCCERGEQVWGVWLLCCLLLGR